MMMEPSLVFLSLSHFYATKRRDRKKSKNPFFPLPRPLFPLFLRRDKRREDGRGRNTSLDDEDDAKLERRGEDGRGREGGGPSVPFFSPGLIFAHFLF